MIKAICLLIAVCQQVYFAPGVEPRTAIVGIIHDAKNEIEGTAYNFSSPEITQALVDAARRGVGQQWIIDHTALSQRHCTAAVLTAEGIPVYDDNQELIHHDKYMIIDRHLVITGSYNFSHNAEHNAENLLVIDDKQIAAQYLADWKKHLVHSTAWKPSHNQRKSK